MAIEIEKGSIRPANVPADLTIDHGGMQELPHRGDVFDNGSVTAKKGRRPFFITFEDIMRRFGITIVPDPEKTKPPNEPST